MPARLNILASKNLLLDQESRSPSYRSTSACPPALGVRVPAQVCGLPEPDRAVVEDLAFAGIEGPPLRGLARDRGGCPARYRVLERAPAPLPVGPQTAAPHRAPPRGRPRAKYLSNLADAPLSPDPRGNVLLAPHRIERHDGAVEMQGIEQLRDGGDLVRLAVDLALSEHQSL